MSLLGKAVSEYLADRHPGWHRLQHYDDEIMVCNISKTLWISIFTKQQKIQPALLRNNTQLPKSYYNDSDFLQKLSSMIELMERAVNRI